jgi:uncharacterized protein (TIGR02646 family)
MRAIQKFKHPPRCLELRRQQGIPAAPSQAWGNFSQSCKEELTRLLLLEQYRLCAYTETRLDELGFHLEHIRPKSHFPGDTFAYENLVLSCLSNAVLEELAKDQQELFGGHYKGNDYDAKLISPLQPDCGRFFSYTPNGEVLPAPGLASTDYERARYTIEVLNLNTPYLRRERRLIITETIHLINELLDDDTALHHFAEADLCVISSGLNPPVYPHLTPPPP